MFNAQSLLNQLLNSGSQLLKQAPTAGQGSATQGGMDPVLQGILSGVGGGMLGSAFGQRSSSMAKIGGAATVAAMAYRAYQNYQANNAAKTTQTTAAAPSALTSSPTAQDWGREGAPMLDFAFESPQAEAQQSQAMLVAMVAAAKADAVYDNQERALLQQELDKLHKDPEAQAWLQAEIKKPLDLAYVAAQASTPHIGAEMYLVSRMVCAGLNAQEQRYLDQLAQALAISNEHRASIEAQISGAPAEPPRLS